MKHELKMAFSALLLLGAAGAGLLTSRNGSETRKLRLTERASEQTLQRPIRVGSIDFQVKPQEAGSRTDGFEELRFQRATQDYREFFRLKKKAILSSQEKELFHDTLSNPKLIAECREILLASDESEFSLDSQELRMSVVEYLDQGLSWLANPARAELLDVSTEIIQRDVKKLELPLLLKKSLAGDQIELFQIVQNAEPALAEELERKQSHGPLKNLIAFAISQNERK